MSTTKRRRLAPMLISLLIVAAVLGALVTAALGAMSSKALKEKPQLVAYPKMSEQQVERINDLFDPPLPFNENVVADAFQDRAGLSKSATDAAFAAPVVQTGTARGTLAPSGYDRTGSGQPPLQNPVAAPAPQSAADVNKARAEEARRSGKIGKPDESTIYGWREVLPLGIVGFQGEDANGQAIMVKEVMFKSTVTRRNFTARKNTRFADATLESVTATGVVFRDASGTHEVGWARSRAAANGQRQSPNNSPATSPLGGVHPSGYADGVISNASRRP